MYAITIRLPWAAAMRDGEKLIENRGRPIAERFVGQRLAVHAGASWSAEGAKDWRIRRWWYGHTAARSLSRTGLSEYFGRVLAVATLTGCHKADPGDWEGTNRSCCFPWGDNLYGGPTRTNHRSPAYHLTFADVAPLDVPVETRGYLSVPWLMPTDHARKVLDQLPEVSGV